MARPWQGSTRAARLPAGWSAIRARILRRDPTCRLSAAGCTVRSTEVDHVVPGDDHSDGNLQGLCASCHRLKTAHETALRNGAKPRQRRAAERHPGLR